MSEIGENVDAEFSEGKVLLDIDLTKEIGLTKSGKNMLIGSTHGMVKLMVPGEGFVTVAVNVFKAKE